MTKIVDGSGLTSFVYNLLGQVTSKVAVIAGKSYTTAFTYTQTGKLASMTYPSGRVMTTSFTATRKVTGVTTK